MTVKRDVVEILAERNGHRVIIWPKHDGEDRVEMTAASTGVLLAIIDNACFSRDNAVFLTLEELDRLASEGRKLCEEYAAKRRPADAP